MSYRKHTHKGDFGGEVKSYARCYESHPPLKINEYQIYGGSCLYPAVKDADIYVGFDMGIAHNDKAYPWEQGESFLYHIQDMGVPKNPDSFKKLIEWLSVQLIAQKKVHIGCIGGHGRTGMVLAALVTHMTGEKDSITYVRKNYCEKAVESAVQVNFLATHFGITAVAGAKEGMHRHAATNQPVSTFPTMQSFSRKQDKIPEYEMSTKGEVIQPAKGKISIWG